MAGPASVGPARRHSDAVPADTIVRTFGEVAESGRTRLPAKEVTAARWSVGSNPTLSARSPRSTGLGLLRVRRSVGAEWTALSGCRQAETSPDQLVCRRLERS